MRDYPILPCGAWEGDYPRDGGGGGPVQQVYREDGLYGEAGHDRMYGGPATDSLRGGPGNDTISGDVGRDVLTGGSGLDNFIYTANGNFLFGGHGIDIITDFQPRGRDGDLITLKIVGSNSLGDHVIANATLTIGAQQ